MTKPPTLITIEARGKSDQGELQDSSSSSEVRVLDLHESVFNVQLHLQLVSS